MLTSMYHALINITLTTGSRAYCIEVTLIGEPCIKWPGPIRAAKYRVSHLIYLPGKVEYIANSWGKQLAFVIVSEFHA